VRRAAAVAALALGWAAPAPAATLSIDGYGLATYRAAPGEPNRLAIDATAQPGATTFRDAGAPIESGAGCTAQGDGAVACSNAHGFAPLADVDLGDGDDVIAVHGGGVHALLGPGADRASADLGRLELEGGPGPDVVSAGPRTDVEAEYFDHVVGVRVSLDGRANDGAPGEGDDVGRGVRTVDGSNQGDVLDARGASGVVHLYGNGGSDHLYASPAGGSLYGSTGADVLRGGPGRDTIGGAEGDDVLAGAGGDDALDGGAGRNVVTGGPGHDRIDVHGNRYDVIRVRDGARDDVVCDAGLPRRLEVDAGDRLRACAFPVAAEADPPRLLAGRRLRLLLACPYPAPGGCVGTVRLTDSAPRPLGRARFAIAAGGRAHVTVRLDHRPRHDVVTAVVIAHRARPPASTRTTVTTLRLASP
jgi:hypothetical protein